MKHRHMPASTDNLTLFELTERYPDEASAVAYFEAHRWPNGPHCPDCGSTAIYDCRAKRRLPLLKCRDCGEQFTVTSGTVMEHTMLPLRKWLIAFHLLGGSKKGVSARYLSRALKVTPKTAWHLAHRIRATMTDNAQRFSGIVETDETYIGGRRKHVGKGYRKNKIAVQTIVQRSGGKQFGKRGGKHRGKRFTGQAQTIALNPDAERVDGRTVGAKLRTHTDPENTILMTDESAIYAKVGESFEEHHRVHHKSEDYAHVAEDGHLVHTNTAEGLFANLKRQITGTHHHTSKKHLPRYLEEFDYKYNTRDASDGSRTVAAIRRMEGKRVTLYKTKGGGDSLFDRGRPDDGTGGKKKGDGE